MRSTITEFLVRPGHGPRARLLIEFGHTSDGVLLAMGIWDALKDALEAELSPPLTGMELFGAWHEGELLMACRYREGTFEIVADPFDIVWVHAIQQRNHERVITDIARALDSNPSFCRVPILRTAGS